MTDKQKKTLTRILVTFAIFAVLFVLEHMGKLENVNTFVLLIIYLVPYLIIGYDIILKAVKNISHGQVFDTIYLLQNLLQKLHLLHFSSNTGFHHLEFRMFSE